MQQKRSLQWTILDVVLRGDTFLSLLINGDRDKYARFLLLHID